SELYKCDEQYKQFLPDFNFQVIDLTDYSDSQIQGMVYLRVAFLIMKYYFRDDLDNKLAEILSLLADLIQQKSTMDFLGVVLEYIGTNKFCDDYFLKENLDKAFNNKGEQIMYSVADKWKNIGRIEGEKKGKKEGKKEGKTEILAYLFEERFGKVPQQMKKQINQVDDKLIEDLTRSFFSFNSLNDYYLWWDKHYSARA
ncbi:transposase YhgA family protein, partial [Candidatus Magnetomorum sp. HK-1]